MVKTLPTIRAANLLPIVRWMDANKRPTQRSLNEVGLGCWFNLSPEDPIPVFNAISFLKNASAQEGADFPCRVLSSASVAELAFIGRLALGAQTPKEALTRVATFLPMHSSHENILIDSSGSELRVSESWRLDLDAESLHAIHVLLASMISQICSFATMNMRSVQQFEIVPHPQLGIGHLKKWFGNSIVASSEPIFTAKIGNDVANRRFRIVSKDRLQSLAKLNIPPLAEDRTLAGSIRPVLESLLYGGEPTVHDISAAMRMSVRTLQRRMAEEETSFSQELEKVRAKLAKKMLLNDGASLHEISERLGYASSSSLSRAVRRMTGLPPAQFSKTQRTSVL